MLWPSLLLLVFVSSSVAQSQAQSSQCSFQRGDISANWSVSDQMITIKFTKSNLGNNMWTGIAFGPGMSNQEVVLFRVMNFHAEILTGYTTGYAPPTLTPSLTVTPIMVNYNSNRLTASFTRPLAANGPNMKGLSQCMTWSFVDSGSVVNGGGVGKHFAMPQQVNNVCPQQCQSTSNTPQRDYALNPVPLDALFNNKESQRYNGLYGQK